MWKYFVVFCVLLVALCQVESRRGGGRRGGGRRRGGGAARGIPPGASDIVQWVRVLPAKQGGGEVEVQESSYSDGAQVVIMSKDKRALRQTEFKPSKMIYDFTAGSPPMAVIKVKKTCFLMTVPDDLTKESLLAQIAPFSGARREMGVMASQNAAPLTQEQTQSLESRADLAAHCANNRKPPMALSDAPLPDGAASKTVKVSALESALAITKPKRANAGRNRGRGGRGRGRGGRRGGRREQ